MTTFSFFMGLPSLFRRGPFGFESFVAFFCQAQKLLFPEAEVMRLNDARTLLIVPLIAADEAVGLMELYDARPRVFSSDEQRLALALGRYLAATLQRLATR